jgi:hypothetical protein
VTRVSGLSVSAAMTTAPGSANLELIDIRPPLPVDRDSTPAG